MASWELKTGSSLVNYAKNLLKTQCPRGRVTDEIKRHDLRQRQCRIESAAKRVLTRYAQQVQFRRQGI